MVSLSNKRIVLGVTGGIAAYKSAELVRRLRDAGAEVQVVMTEAATGFVTPLTFQALSGRVVRTDLLDPDAEAAMGHIELARWADAILIAPASADTLARLTLGRADDLLCAVVLASEAPCLLAPAMNRVMWAAAATQENVARLATRGHTILGPGEGDQACGETGAGRMLEPQELVAALTASFGSGLLSGKRVLLTAGPTRESLDPVRYISNHSSGKMGYALAAEAQAAGADVVLVSGPVTLEPPAGVRHVPVTDAEQMLAAVETEVEACDIFIATAAVVDYRPEQTSEHKIKKSGEGMTLQLVPNPDILARVAARDPAPFTVGFAAETRDLEDYARAKLKAKRLDMIAANLVGRAGTGFNADENELAVFWANGGTTIERASKAQVARQLIALIAERL